MPKRGFLRQHWVPQGSGLDAGVDSARCWESPENADDRNCLSRSKNVASTISNLWHSSIADSRCLCILLNSDLSILHHSSKQKLFISLLSSVKASWCWLPLDALRSTAWAGVPRSSRKGWTSALGTSTAQHSVVCEQHTVLIIQSFLGTCRFVLFTMFPKILWQVSLKWWAFWHKLRRVLEILPTVVLL